MAGVKQPDDKSYFILPDLGEGIAEAELIEWKVKEGDTVEEHQTLAEMETDKARVEVPSPWTGVIKKLNGKPGDIINVGEKLVLYDVSGSAKSAPTKKTAAAAVSSNGAATTGSADSEEKEDAGTVVGTVDSTLTVSDRFSRSRTEVEVTAGSAKALATPAVRKIARELGVDINTVNGTGRGGRVTASDIELYASSAPGAPGTVLSTAPAPSRMTATPEPAFTQPQVSEDGIAQRIPIIGTRRKIAQALRQSLSTAVHFTVVEEADITKLEVKRKELIYATGEKVSPLAFILTAVCKALRDHPTLNANVDDENNEFLIKSVINLGVAVDTEHGLMVPVLFNSDQSSIVELNRRVKDVARRCADRSIPREELVGGTFTISNVGAFGGIFATPIINYPEVGILGTGRARQQVIPRDGGFHLGTILPLSLSCDHRVVDGAEGARFLTTLRSYLENPDKLLHP